MILAALFWRFYIRRRRTKVRESWVNGVEKPERNVFGRRPNSSVQYIQDLHPGSSSPISPHTDVSDSYIPTPYTVQGSASSPSATGSIFHPLTERPISAAHLSPVVARRTNKIAELDEARRLAVVGSGVSSSSGASAAGPHDVPLLLTPTAQRTSAAADSSVVPVVAVSNHTTTINQRSNPNDSHPVGLPDEPPPQYDAVA